MAVMKDLKRIIFQALGKENTFGYKTTLANQLYLMYCLMGGMYYTNKIHRKTKITWFCNTYSGCIPIIFSVILYVIYGRHTGGLILLIYNGFPVIITWLELFLRPAIMLSYKHDIEEMIRTADKILTKKPTTTGRYIGVKFDVKQVLGYFLIAFLMPTVLFSGVFFLEMVFFYEEEKVKDPMFYIVPLSGLEHFGYSTYLHIFITSVSAWMQLFFYLMCTANRILAITWVIICHNEAQRIINELNSLSMDADINIDTYRSIEPRFNEILRKCILDINDLTRLISSFRDYFQTAAGVILPVLLYVEVIHAMLLVLPAFPFMLKARELLIFLGTLSEVYVICWVGTTLQQMTSDLSFAVYSTPWYWVVGNRKDVYILLCQTQAPISPVALNVYPLTLPLFLRFCNIIHSIVNVARANTRLK